MACPVCEEPTSAACRPFCSKRCADIDLGRWLNEDYRIPTDEIEGDDMQVPADDRRGALAH